MRRFLWACLALAATTARADLYKANEALAAKDLPRAFELYRELAQIGQPDSQGNLAVMYANGEGVPRNNLLGYAWATIARDNGVSTVQPIIDQIEPHLTDAARARVAEVVSQYGREALQRTLLPAEKDTVVDPDAPRCTMKAFANPDQFYPMEAKRAEISGSVMMEARVAADGSTRAPLAWFSFPEGVFDGAGRAVAMKSRYSPKIENGVAVPCSVRFFVHFTVGDGVSILAKPSKRQLEVAAELRQKAESGDPNSQLAYGFTLLVRSALRSEDEKPGRWLLKAAQAGVPAAQYLIGAQLMARTAESSELAKGALWLEMATKGGSVAARTMLARYLLGAQRDAASHEQGLALMRRAAEANHREGVFLLAALLVTWPEPAQRDPARALKLLDQVDDLFNYDPTLFEIRAAAQSALGKFDDAQTSQSRAIKKAKGLGWDTAALESRLALYQQKQQFSGALIEF
jgi:uncharacterized protein